MRTNFDDSTIFWSHLFNNISGDGHKPTGPSLILLSCHYPWCWTVNAPTCAEVLWISYCWNSSFFCVRHVMCLWLLVLTTQLICYGNRLYVALCKESSKMNSTYQEQTRLKTKMNSFERTFRKSTKCTIYRKGASIKDPWESKWLTSNYFTMLDCFTWTVEGGFKILGNW